MVECLEEWVLYSLKLPHSFPVLNEISAFLHLFLAPLVLATVRYLFLFFSFLKLNNFVALL